MKDTLSYNGKITITKVIGDKKYSSKVLNSGTTELFKTYAKALTGMSVQDELPHYINFRDEDYTSVMSVNGASVIRGLVTSEENSDDTDIGTNLPCARMSCTVLGTMLNSNVNSARYITLDNKRGTTLAYATLSEDMVYTLGRLSPGNQLLIVWDLFITNGKESD